MKKSIVLCLSGLFLLILLYSCGKSDDNNATKITDESMQEYEFDDYKIPEEIAPQLELEDIAYYHLIKGKEYSLGYADLEYRPLIIFGIIIEYDEADEADKVKRMSYYKKSAERNLSECYRILETYLKNHPETEHHWINWPLAEYFRWKGDLENARIYYIKGSRCDYSQIWCLEALVAITYRDFENHNISEQNFIEGMRYYGRKIYESLPCSVDAYYQRVIQFEGSIENIKKYTRMNLLYLYYPMDRAPYNGLRDETPQGVKYPEKLLETFKGSDDLAAESEKYRTIAEDYFKDGKDGASDLYKKSIESWEHIAGTSLYRTDISSGVLHSVGDRLGVDIDIDNKRSLNMIVGDAYVRYAEIFQKETEMGRKSETYNKMSKQAKDDIELEQMVKNRIIGSYKKAIFCYYQDNYIAPSRKLIEKNYRQIAECRKRIRELESQLKQDKPPESKPK